MEVPLDEPHEGAPVELPVLEQRSDVEGGRAAGGATSSAREEARGNLRGDEDADEDQHQDPWPHCRELAEELGLPARPRLFHSRLRAVPFSDVHFSRGSLGSSAPAVPRDAMLPTLSIPSLGTAASRASPRPPLSDEEDIFLDDVKATDSVTLSSARFHDPVLLNWENLTSFRNFWQKILFGFLIMFATMLLWTLLYITYAVFYISLIPNIPGLGINDQSFVKDFLLGLLVGVGNGILYYVIDRVMRSAGFRTRDEMDVAILGRRGCA